MVTPALNNGDAVGAIAEAATTRRIKKIVGELKGEDGIRPNGVKYTDGLPISYTHMKNQFASEP